MKKLISLLSFFVVGSSSILTSYSTIDTANKNNIINTLNKNKNDDVQSGVFLFNPDVKINTLDNNPLLKSNLSPQEQKYCDFVFLKSIYGDPDNNRDKTTISIDYTFSNIIKYDTKYDPEDINQDKADFTIMEQQKDAYGHTGIEEGKSLLNKYLNNSFLLFNSKGIIPSRKQYFDSLKNNTSVQQTIIINKYSSFNDIKDYISFNLHWYGVDLKLGYKLADPIIYNVIDFAINSAYVTYGLAIYEAQQVLEGYIEDFVDSAVEEVVELVAESTLELDVEAPEVAVILDGVTTILSTLICKAIDDQLEWLVNQSLLFADDIKNTLENKLRTFIGEQRLDIEFDTTWILFGSKIKIDIDDSVKTVTEHTLTPAQADPIIHSNSIMIGSTDNFMTIFSSEDWSEIVDKLEFHGSVASFVNGIVSRNPNINLTDKDWKQIYKKLKKKNNGRTYVKSGYSFAMHIERVNNKFQILYDNINLTDETTTMPYANQAGEIKESFVGTIDKNNLVINTNQFSSLLFSYQYDQKYWKEIKSKDHPKETNANDYFYDNSINNRFWIDSTITKDKIIEEISAYNNAFYIPNSITDPKAKKTFTLSQFVDMTTNTKNIMNISSSIGIDGVKK